MLLVLMGGLLARADVPVKVEPVTARHGMVVAAHPEAAAIGVAVLQAGGNAIDAAVAVSLAVGVAEPYGSGLGGKLMLIYHDAKTGRTFAVDGMDACGSRFEVNAYAKLGEEAHSYGYRAICVPGLAAGLWEAHRRWGGRRWADDVQPAIDLARRGFEVLPKTRDFFAEQERKLRRGDPEIARLYLPDGKLPAVGTRLANQDLARTMERLAAEGRNGFYRGEVAGLIVAAIEQHGGICSREDFAQYEARIVAPIEISFHGYRLVAAPPPATGPALFLTILKAVEPDTWSGGMLRTPDNLNRVGAVWRVVLPLVSRQIADVGQSRFNFEKLVAPESIAEIRAKAGGPVAGEPAKVAVTDEAFYENPFAATTQWMIVDAAGNIACCTQSESLHFGAGVVAPGTGVVLNDSMSNFSYAEPKSLNYIAAGKRPRSTIGPTIAFRDGRPAFAMGIPGAARIPTAMLQALLDRIVFARPMADAIGDTRVHYVSASRQGERESFEAESSLPAATVEGLRSKGWRVELPEEPGRGRHFGGINVIEFNADGTLTGYPDPRRTNAAAGY